MNKPYARITINYPDLSQQSYSIDEKDDLLDVYRLLDRITEKQTRKIIDEVNNRRGGWSWIDNPPPPPRS